jgi:hypothetical protein
MDIVFLLFAIVWYLAPKVFCIWLFVKFCRAGKRVFDQLYYGTYLR